MRPLAGWSRWSRINDSAKTNPDYDFEDILPDLRNSEMWNLIPGRETWAWLAVRSAVGFEANALNCRASWKSWDSVCPSRWTSLVSTAKALKDANPKWRASRCGSLNWATIHPGFMTMFSSYGCVDYDDEMKPQMNSECAVEVTEKWAQMSVNPARSLDHLHLVSVRLGLRRGQGGYAVRC